MEENLPLSSFCMILGLQTTTSPLQSSHPAWHCPCPAPLSPAHPQICNTPTGVLTCAGDTSGVRVGAGLVSGVPHGAEHEEGFIPHTLQLSVPHGTSPFSKVSCPGDRQGCATLQLSADHIGSFGTKVGVTDSFPLVPIMDLHSS